MSKNTPIASAEILKLTKSLPTPFYIYDEKGMRENAKRLNKAFSWAPNFKEYFAVKATPNPFLMDIFKSENVGADCSSVAELKLSQAVGYSGEDVMFTSNNTQAYEYELCKEIGGVINIDDITHIEYLAKNVGIPETICFRYNPGPLREGNVIIGKPEEAKYGLTRDQLFSAYKSVQELGAKNLGLHTMVASNELDLNFFVETARMLFELVIELDKQGTKISFVNLGGGIGIPYRPGQVPVDLEELGRRIKDVYEEMIVPAGLAPLRITMENGRMMTGPYGCLVTKVIHFKNIYKNYVGVDACMSNLMRPGMYGAYHHITVLGKENAKHDKVYDVVGSLCENNDKFAIDRELPQVETDDIIVIHDAGAHGHAMGFQYNGKLRCAEYLYQTDGTVKEIRREETLDDYFATLSFPGL